MFFNVVLFLAFSTFLDSRVTDTMPTIPFPPIPKISGQEIRANSKRRLNSIEAMYVDNGFLKGSDGFVKCYSCETKVKPISLTSEEIAKLHKPDCEVQRDNLDYICRQSILINTRRPRGTESFSNKVIFDALSYGFSKESIEKAAKDFFVNYGAYPEIGDLVDYITRG